ncbi:hypothetical protein ACFQZ4_17685 [Catellatospora coxensis]
MTAGIRSRRAGGISPEEARNRPLYARVLGLQYVRPSSLLCFLYFEGTVALAVLLSLAELTGWWAVAVLPVSVAVMVKLNDVIAGATTRSGGATTRSRGQATRPKSAARALAQPTVRLRVAAPAEGTRPPRRAERPTDDDRDPFPTRPTHQDPSSPRNGTGNDIPDPYSGPTGYGEQGGYGQQQQDPYADRTSYPGQDTYAGPTGYGAPAPAPSATAASDADEPWLSTAEQRARQSAAYRYE